MLPRWRASSATVSPPPRWTSTPTPSTRTKRPPARDCRKSWRFESHIRTHISKLTKNILSGVYRKDSIVISCPVPSIFRRLSSFGLISSSMSGFRSIPPQFANLINLFEQGGAFKLFLANIFAVKFSNTA